MCAQIGLWHFRLLKHVVVIFVFGYTNETMCSNILVFWVFFFNYNTSCDKLVAILHIVKKLMSNFWFFNLARYSDTFVWSIHCTFCRIVTVYCFVIFNHFLHNFAVLPCLSVDSKFYVWRLIKRRKSNLFVLTFTKALSKN